MNRRNQLGLAGVLLALLHACTHRDDLDAIRRVMVQGSAGQASAVQVSDSYGGTGQEYDVTGRTNVGGAAERASAAGATDGFRVFGSPLLRGIPILTTRLSDFTHYDEHDRTLRPEVVGIDDQVFALAERFPYGSGNGARGSAGFFGPTHHAIETGDLLRAFFWARCVMPDPKYGDCRIALVFEGVSEPYLNGGLEFFVHVGQTWSLFSQVFASMKSYLAGEVQLTFQLGYPDQSLEIGAIGLENYDTTLTLTQLESLDAHPSIPIVLSNAFLSYGDAVCEPRVDMEYPFGSATRCSTLDVQFRAPEDSGYQGRNGRVVRAGDVMLVTFWARCAQSSISDGSCRSAVVFEETQAPYLNAGLRTPTVVIGPEWQQYTFPFVATKSYDAEQVKLGIRLGYSEQILELGPVTVVQYGPELQVNDLPESYTEDITTP